MTIPEQAKLIEQIKPILSQHKPERAELVKVLQEVQQTLGYLPKEAMLEISSYMELPASAVYGVATFYNEFRFTPLGRTPIKVCLGTACHMRGGQLVLDALERELDIKVGGITPDGEYSIDRVACIGCCVLAPVAVFGEDIQSKLTPFRVEEVLANLRKDGRKAE